MKTNHKHLYDPAFPFMASVSPPTLPTNGHRIRIDFAPSADEVARKVYLNYGNRAALPGEELHHWLEAEAQLLTERILTQLTASPTWIASNPSGQRHPSDLPSSASTKTNTNR